MASAYIALDIMSFLIILLLAFELNALEINREQSAKTSPNQQRIQLTSPKAQPKNNIIAKKLDNQPQQQQKLQLRMGDKIHKSKPSELIQLSPRIIRMLDFEFMLYKLDFGRQRYNLINEHDVTSELYRSQPRKSIIHPVMKTM